MKSVGKAAIGIAAVALLGALGAAAFLASHGDRAEAKTASEQVVADTASGRVPVVVAAARAMTFENRLVIPGNVQAKRFALVSARMPGPLDAVFVEKGDVVGAGQTRLFQTDSVKLSKAVAVAQQELTVAECSVREKLASLEQSTAHSEQATKDFERYRELARQNAISAQAFEQQGSQVRQAEAMVKHKQALIALAESQLEQARLALTMAEKDLADSLVLAPICGLVSERRMEPGEMAAPGSPVVKIEDPALLEVSIHVPDKFYAEIEPGRTSMRIEVGGCEVGTYPVAYRSPTIHSKQRTFEVHALIESPPANVVPGCLAKVAVILDRRSGIGVPSSAIQVRGGRKVLFTVENDRARMLDLETGHEADGWTEITSGGFSPGMPVVTMGQAFLEEGTGVSPVEESAP